MADGQPDIDSLLRRAADDERRLLKREQRAERDLADARAELERELDRLRRAQQRLERREAEVAEAAARLRRRQAVRAAGPEPIVVEAAPPAADGAGSTTPPGAILAEATAEGSEERANGREDETERPDVGDGTSGGRPVVRAG